MSTGVATDDDTLLAGVLRRLIRHAETEGWLGDYFVDDPEVLRLGLEADVEITPQEVEAVRRVLTPRSR